MENENKKDIEELEPILHAHAHGTGRRMEEAAVRERIENRAARMEHRRRRKGRHPRLHQRAGEGLGGNRHARRGGRRRTGEQHARERRQRERR